MNVCVCVLIIVVAYVSLISVCECECLHITSGITIVLRAGCLYV